jgi:hypothetical protein
MSAMLRTMRTRRVAMGKIIGGRMEVMVRVMGMVGPNPTARDGLGVVANI